MDEQGQRLAYRVRSAEEQDDGALRAAVGCTLAHPDGQGKRESFRGAATRGDLLVLERFDRQEKEWRIAGFVECHMRVDDSLTIRDLGTSGSEPHSGVVRYLLDDVFSSYRPDAAQVKVRRDAEAWRAIIQSIPGFRLEGEEYRRPHYWGVWAWDRKRQQDELRALRQPQRAESPRPPRPPAAPGPNRGAGDFSRGRDRPLGGRNQPGPGPRRGPGPWQRPPGSSGAGPARPGAPPRRPG